MAEKKKNVVVIGGGTGTHTVLKGLKKYTDTIDITAVISMADSGGSTGRLRDEFGRLPVGDVRMALAALARDTSEHEELLRELFLYRFEKGTGLSGHNFGNLFLTALTEILGTEAEAVAAASKILRVRGQVLPVTVDDVQLLATYDDGVQVLGEHAIDDPSPDRKGHRIESLSTEPRGVINPEVQEVFRTADLIVIGPGDLFSSIIANFAIAGMKESVRESAGEIVYVSNLMERFGQTEGMSIADCTAVLCAYMGRCPEVILVNNAPLPDVVVKEYAAKEDVHPVVDDADTLTGNIVRSDLITHDAPVQHSTDTVKRSLIRHDSDKLARALMSLLK